MDDRQQFMQPVYSTIYVVRDEEVAFKSAEVTAAASKVFEPFRGERRSWAPSQLERAEPDDQTE
jgi:hypothetical protein